MRRLHITLVGVLAASLVAAALAGTASASAPMQASGTFTQSVFNETLIKQVGGTSYYASHDTQTFTGTFTGTQTFDGIIEISANGSIKWAGKATFTGTVAGCGSGTVVMLEAGTADSMTGPAHCDHVLIGGSLPVRGLLDLKGVLGNLNYSGSYSC